MKFTKLPLYLQYKSLFCQANLHKRHLPGPGRLQWILQAGFHPFKNV